jgi:hypothetical protein
MSQFDPSQGSQALMRPAGLHERCADLPEIRAFRTFDFVSGRPVCRIRGGKSAKVSGLVRKYSRFAETNGGDWFDHDCRPIEAVVFGHASSRKN